jgi:NAD(P)H-dependent FMN reductase
MEPIKIAVIIGSTRPNRFSEKPGKWIAEEAKKLEGVEVETLDLRDWPLPFFDDPESPSGVVDGDYGDDLVNAWAKKIDAADAFIMVTPEYNHSTSGVLKNALDSVWKEWNDKPVGFVGYGGVGGARAVEHLRGIAIELEMPPVRTGVHIPGEHVWGSTGWNDEVAARFNRGAGGMLKQLVRWARALKAVRSR